MLEIKDISKSFQNKKVLDNFSLTVKKGEIICLVGPSGGGKTTLLRAISGLETIDTGEILLNNQAVATQKEAIGVAFQEFHLFPHLNVLDNLRLAPKLKKQEPPEDIQAKAEHLLEKFELSERKQHFPYQLSGGQKQRVAIARALMLTPDVLCYDEPTSALDPLLRESVAAVILSLKADKVTQIVVTHDEQFAEKIGDRIIKINPK